MVGKKSKAEKERENKKRRKSGEEAREEVEKKAEKVFWWFFEIFENLWKIYLLSIIIYPFIFCVLSTNLEAVKSSRQKRQQLQRYGVSDGEPKPVGFWWDGTRRIIRLLLLRRRLLLLLQKQKKKKVKQGARRRGQTKKERRRHCRRRAGKWGRVWPRKVWGQKIANKEQKWGKFYLLYIFFYLFILAGQWSWLASRAEKGQWRHLLCPPSSQQGTMCRLQQRLGLAKTTWPQRTRTRGVVQRLQELHQEVAGQGIYWRLLQHHRGRKFYFKFSKLKIQGNMNCDIEGKRVGGCKPCWMAKYSDICDDQKSKSSVQRYWR